MSVPGKSASLSSSAYEQTKQKLRLQGQGSASELSSEVPSDNSNGIGFSGYKPVKYIGASTDAEAVPDTFVTSLDLPDKQLQTLLDGIKESQYTLQKSGDMLALGSAKVDSHQSDISMYMGTFRRKCYSKQIYQQNQNSALYTKLMTEQEEQKKHLYEVKKEANEKVRLLRVHLQTKITKARQEVELTHKGEKEEVLKKVTEVEKEYEEKLQAEQEQKRILENEIHEKDHYITTLKQMEKAIQHKMLDFQENIHNMDKSHKEQEKGYLFKLRQLESTIKERDTELQSVRMQAQTTVAGLKNNIDMQERENATLQKIVQELRNVQEDAMKRIVGEKDKEQERQYAENKQYQEKNQTCHNMLEKLKFQLQDKEKQLEEHKKTEAIYLAERDQKDKEHEKTMQQVEERVRRVLQVKEASIDKLRQELTQLQKVVDS